MGTITNTCADVSVIIALAGVIITFVGVIVALGIFIRQNKQIKKITSSFLKNSGSQRKLIANYCELV